MVKIFVKLSEEKIEFDVDLTITLEEFRELVSQKLNVPAPQQRLIFKGHILKDGRTLQDYKLEEGCTIIMVKGKAPESAASSASATPLPSPSPAAAATPSGAPQSAAANSASRPAANPLDPFGFGMFGGQNTANMGNMGNMGNMANLFDPNMMQQMQAQLMSNPEMMRQIMDSPMMQGLLNNPETLRSMIMSNPQIQQLAERNPELQYILNDSQALRQGLELARNPELFREMMRNADRAMSNIEAHPGGFQALRRMYHQVSEPMMEASINQHRQSLGLDNPDSSASSGSSTTSSTSSDPNPNTQPLPNPWAASQPARAGSAGASQSSSATSSASNAAANPFLSMFGNMGAFPGFPPASGQAASQGSAQSTSSTSAAQSASTAPSLESMYSAMNLNAGSGMGMMGGMNMNQMMQMMQDPMFQQMAEAIRQNPQLVTQNPLLTSMAQRDPQMRNLLNVFETQANFQRAMGVNPAAPNATAPTAAAPSDATTGAAASGSSAPTQAPSTTASTGAAQPNPMMNPFFAGFPMMNMFGGIPQGQNSTATNVNSTAATGQSQTTGSTQSQAAPPMFNPFLLGQFPGFGFPAQSAVPADVRPEIVYREQLAQLQDMGFTDAQANLSALIATGGNLQAAINRLIGN